MRKAFFQLHIAVFLAGFTGILGKLITLNEGLLVWYRLMLTALTMWILFSLRKQVQRISRADILRIAGVGIFAAMHWVLFYASIKYANVSVGLVCLSASGLFTALLEPLIERKRVRINEIILGIITMTGIAIIFHFDTRYKLGIAIGLVSTFFASLFPIFNRRYLQRVNVETLLCWQQTGGFVFLSLMLPVYLQFNSVNTITPGMNDFMWLLVLSWLCSVLAFKFSTNALRHLSAFTVNLSYNLEPVYGILLAFAVLNENEYLGTGFYVGFAVILSALVIHLVQLMKVERKIPDIPVS